jgi:long-chain acyl-CoA synthetase
MDAIAHPQSFAEITRKLADSQPDRVALSFEGRHTTYADLEKHTNQVANALIAAGIKKGDRIAYLGKNSDSYFEVFLGAGKMVDTTTPINWRLAGPEIVYILQDSRAPFLFVGP